MARIELPNGVILPAEYSDDWYEDMTSNLTKLDDVIGSDSEKLNADSVDFLRMSSATLTDGGTGNFSDLNSSYKIKTSDLILDSGRKLYQVVSVDSTNETFTVGNLLFKITAESDLAPVAESGDYSDLDNKPDLNPYDQHLANTEIHVTTADKNKWNNGVSQAYVFRYSSTALVASSTNSNTLLDNTDNLKVGDKVIDSSGVLFSITAIDNVNSTFTVGSALVDLALDANVVHTSGNETIGGIKTFSNDIRISKASSFCNVFSSGYIKGQAPSSNIYSGVRFFDDINSGSVNTITGGFEVEYNRDGYNKSYIASRNYAGETNKVFTVGLRVPNDDIRSIDFLPSVSNIVNLGISTNKWKSFNGVEPSSLSLPSGTLSNQIDISSYFTNTGTGDTNTYVASANGWIYLRLGNISGCLATVYDSNNNLMWGQSSTGSVEQITIPILKGQTLSTQWNTSSTVTVAIARFIPCLGNV